MGKYDFDDSEGVWRTVGGRRIFIREGQSLSDAMKSSGKFKSGKKVKAEGYSHKIDEDYEERLSKYKEIQKDANKRYDKGEIDKEERNKLIDDAHDKYIKQKEKSDYQAKQEKDNTLDEQLKDNDYSEDKKAQDKSRSLQSIEEKYNEKIKDIAEKRSNGELSGEEYYKQREELQRQLSKEYNDELERKYPGAKKEVEGKAKEAAKSVDDFVRNNPRWEEGEYDEEEADEMFEKNGSRTWDVVYDRLEEKAHEKNNIEKMVKKGNTYIPVRKGENEKDVLQDYKARNNPDTIEAIKEAQNNERSLQDGIKISLGEKGKKEIEDAQTRRNKIIKFMQNNKGTIDKWVKEYDEDTVMGKIEQGKSLTAKEYFGFLGSEPKEGSIILAGGKHGEDIKIGKSDNNKYTDYYKKEKLGTPSNYQKGDEIQYTSGYGETVKGTIVREATDNEKEFHINKNLKGYIVKDKNGNESVVADTKIKVGNTTREEAKQQVEGNRVKYQRAFNEYKKQHPKTKLNLDDFIKISEGK